MDVKAVAAGGSEAAGTNRSRSDLRRAAEAFESLLVQMMLEKMREAQLEDGLFGSGPGAAVYEGMFDRGVAESLSRGSPFGIARMLEEQWTRGEESSREARALLDAVERARAQNYYESVTDRDRVVGPDLAHPDRKEASAQVPDLEADKYREDKSRRHRP